MKKLTAVIGLVFLGLLVFIGYHLLRSQPASTKAHNQNAKHIAKTAPKQAASPLSLYPKTSLNCSSEVSLVSLSRDYTVTNMGCIAPAIASGVVFIKCNGTIMQRATDVSLNCYRAGYYSLNDLLNCSGTTNAASSPVNLLLNYTCNLPNMAGANVIYSCSGNIINYDTFSINLPLSVSCGA